MNRVSLYSPGGPRTCYIDQADLELREIHPPASVSRVPGLKCRSPFLVRGFLLVLFRFSFGTPEIESLYEVQPGFEFTL